MYLGYYVNEKIMDELILNIELYSPVMVAERSNACKVFARSEAGTVGSNSAQGMDV
jgi:hypothetical protein